MSEGPKIEVPLLDIFNKFTEVTLALRDLSNKVDGFKDAMEERKKVDEDQESRLRVLERWKYGIPVTIILMVVIEAMRATGKGP